MMFMNENAGIHGGGRAVAGAVVRAFVCESTSVCQVGCRLASIHNKIAKDILLGREVAETPAVDALGEQAVDARL